MISYKNDLQQRLRSRSRRNKIKYLISLIIEGDIQPEEALRKMKNQNIGKRALLKVIKEHGYFSKGRLKDKLRHHRYFQGGAPGLGKRR